MILDTPLRQPGLFRTPLNGRIVAPSSRRLIRSVAVVGASSVEQNQASGSGGNNRYFSNQGIHVWMCAYLRQRMMLAYNASKNTYEFGMFGASNATQLATCVPQAIAAQPDAALLYSSMNDLAGSATTAQMLASTQAMYDALIAGGVRTVIVQAPGPRNVAAAGGVGYFAKQQALIAALASWTSSAGIPFVDVNSAIQNMTTGDWLTGYTYDGSHPNAIASQYAGRALADWMLANVNLGPEPFTSERIAALKGPNPRITGGSATLAANYLNFSSSRSTPYIDNATDGGSRWQGINFHTPDATVNYNNVTTPVSPSLSLAACGLTAGQLVRTWCELNIINGGAIRHLVNFVTNGTGINTSGAIAEGNPTPEVVCPIPAQPLVFAGPVFQIPADATTCNMTQSIVAIIGVPTNRRFRNHGVEVVPDYKPPAIGS